LVVLFVGTTNTADLWYFQYTSYLNAFILPGPLRLGLREHLTAQRSNGLVAMVNRIRNEARARAN
ncbi:MAG: SufE family protein, partial [Devosia sp.]